MKKAEFLKGGDPRGRRRFLLWNACAALGVFFSPLLRRGTGRKEGRLSGGCEARYYRKLKGEP